VKKRCVSLITALHLFELISGSSKSERLVQENLHYFPLILISFYIIKDRSVFFMFFNKQHVTNPSDGAFKNGLHSYKRGNVRKPINQ